MVKTMNALIENKKNPKPVIPWTYARRGFYETAPRFDRNTLEQYGKDYKRAKSAKRVVEKDIKSQIIRAYEV